MEAADWERFLLTENPDVLSAHDADGTFLWAAANAEKVFGWAAAELVGQPLLGQVHPEDQDQVARGLRAVRKTPAAASPLILRYRLRDRDGQYPWLASSVRAPTDTTRAEVIFATRRVARRLLADAAYSEPESEWLAATHREHLVLAVRSWWCR